MREDIKLWIKQFALESTGIHIDETISLSKWRNRSELPFVPDFDLQYKKLLP